MITVSKILGESYDLTTGNENGKSLVLTNGREEILLSVSDDDIRRILRLNMNKNQNPEPGEKTYSTSTFSDVNLEESDEIGEIGGLQDSYQDVDTGTESI